MVRLSKKTRDRSVSYKRPKPSGKMIVSQNKVKEHANAFAGELSQGMFVPKIA